MNLRDKAQIVAVAAFLIALQIVPKHEGTKYVAYKDPIGIPTICSGHTKGVRLGDVASKDVCEQYTREDILEADKIFTRWVSEDIRSQLSPESYAAYLSFILNVGPGKKGVKDGFIYLKSGKHSTMYKKLVAGDFIGSCNQYPLWTKAGGVEFKGLVTRRYEEMILCLTGLS